MLPSDEPLLAACCVHSRLVSRGSKLSMRHSCKSFIVHLQQRAAGLRALHRLERTIYAAGGCGGGSRSSGGGGRG